jgi:hypothetical protein
LLEIDVIATRSVPTPPLRVVTHSVAEIETVSEYDARAQAPYSSSLEPSLQTETEAQRAPLPSQATSRGTAVNDSGATKSVEKLRQHPPFVYRGLEETTMAPPPPPPFNAIRGNFRSTSVAGSSERELIDADIEETVDISAMLDAPNGSKRSVRPPFWLKDSSNTLVGSALERKLTNVKRVDTTERLVEIRRLMAKDNLDY